MQEQLKKRALGSPLLAAGTERQAGLMAACKGKPRVPMTLGPSEFSWEGRHAHP